MSPDDQIRLRHMLDAAVDAVSFSDRRSRADLESDRQLTFALVHCLTVIGEAANHVSDPSRKELSGLPWLQIVGMRNRLVHGYYDINHDILWKTIKEDLPPLIKTIQSSFSK